MEKNKGRRTQKSVWTEGMQTSTMLGEATLGVSPASGPWFVCKQPSSLPCHIKKMAVWKPASILIFSFREDLQESRQHFLPKCGQTSRTLKSNICLLSHGDYWIAVYVLHHVWCKIPYWNRERCGVLPWNILTQFCLNQQLLKVRVHRLFVFISQVRILLSGFPFRGYVCKFYVSNDFSASLLLLIYFEKKDVMWRLGIGAVVKNKDWGTRLHRHICAFRLHQPRVRHLTSQPEHALEWHHVCAVRSYAAAGTYEVYYKFQPLASC